MFPEQAEQEFQRLLSCAQTNPEEATRIERGLASAALMAIESDDVPRAKALAKFALDAQHVRFRRTWDAA